MLVGQFGGFVSRSKFSVENFLEEIFEATVVDFQDGVLGGKIDRVITLQAIVEARTRKATDGFVEVVHGQCNAGFRRFENFFFNRGTAVGGDEFHRQGTGTRKLKIGRAVLVAKTVTGHHHRLIPMAHQTRHVFTNDRLAENSAIENIADGPVRAFPHLLEIEFLHARFVRRDGGALDGDTVFLRCHRRLDSHLVVGSVAVLHAQVKVLEVDVQVGEDQFFADHLPDDARHFVAVHFNDRVLDFDF